MISVDIFGETICRQHRWLRRSLSDACSLFVFSCINFTVILYYKCSIFLRFIQLLFLFFVTFIIYNNMLNIDLWNASFL